MAESPSHKFGQLVGNLLEDVVEPFLSEFAKAENLYLDHQKISRKARKGKKVAWKDRHGNIHDLDFVIERDGSDEVIGAPVAFIEVAWRRYTKHSRNKAQEIQGAILPLAETFQWSNPFLGVVLSGIFTDGSLEQLRSLGFHILYFRYDTLVDAFARSGINIAFDEATPDKQFQNCVKKIEAASSMKMRNIKKHLVNANKSSLDEFIAALKQRLNRMIQKIIVIPLYGKTNEFRTVVDAVKFLEKYSVSEGTDNFQKYEVLVSFSNGDHVEGTFKDKMKAMEFLRFVANQ